MTRQFLGTPGVLPYPRSSIEADEAFAMGRVRTGNEPAAAAKAIAALRAGLATAAGPATGAEIVLNFATDTGLETRHGEEAYTLNTDASGMRICAGGEAGFYYGVQTLLQ